MSVFNDIEWPGSHCQTQDVTTDDHDDARWLARATDLASANVDAGGGPFGAVVVRAGAVVATGQNRVTRDLDPTAHAEVVALRAACVAADDFQLAGHTLYASCEPCPLCMAAALWARVDRVVFSADRHDASSAGFDDSALYDMFGRPRDEWDVPVVQHRLPSAVEPFDAWRDHPHSTAY